MNFYSSINSCCKTSDFLCVNAELAYSALSVFPWNNLLLLTKLQGSLLSAAIKTSVPSENQKADLWSLLKISPGCRAVFALDFYSLLNLKSGIILRVRLSRALTF